MVVDIPGSEAALYMSYFMESSTPTDDGSTYSPDSKSTKRTSKRAKVCSMSSTLMPGSSMPAADRILLLISRFWFWICAGRSMTAAVDTTTEKNTLRTRATNRVLATVSLALATGKPPFDIGLNHVVIHQRCEQVGEQNGQHNAFREGRVNHTDQYGHHTHQNAEAPATGVGHRSRHRVRSHEQHAKSEAAHDQMPVRPNIEERVGFRADHVEQQGGSDHADHNPAHNPPGRDLHDQQRNTTNRHRQGGRLTDGPLNRTQERAHPADVLLQRFQTTGSRPAQGCRSRETIDSSPHSVTGNLCRVRKVQERTSGQGRVQEVLASSAKHFLADHYTKGNAQRYLPQRNAGRTDQCKQYRGYEEAF